MYTDYFLCKKFKLRCLVKNQCCPYLSLLCRLSKRDLENHWTQMRYTVIFKVECLLDSALCTTCRCTVLETYYKVGLTWACAIICYRLQFIEMIFTRGWYITAAVLVVNISLSMVEVLKFLYLNTHHPLTAGHLHKFTRFHILCTHFSV